MHQHWTDLRTFTTANFRVVLSCTEDDDLDLSWDETGEVAEKLESGEWTNFLFRVAVHGPTGELAADYLGGSIYADPTDFMDHRKCGLLNRVYAAEGKTVRCGGYFSDMVGRACDEARKEWERVSRRVAGTGLLRAA